MTEQGAMHVSILSVLTASMWQSLSSLKVRQANVHSFMHYLHFVVFPFSLWYKVKLLLRPKLKPHMPSAVRVVTNHINDLLGHLNSYIAALLSILPF